jgi:hypothetical protein
LLAIKNKFNALAKLSPFRETMDLSMTDRSFSVVTPSILRHIVLMVCLTGVLKDGDLVGDDSIAWCWFVRSFIGDLTVATEAPEPAAALPVLRTPSN